MSGAPAEREAGEVPAQDAAAAEEDSHEGRRPRISAVMRESEQVTPLELFFDLVFVLALTQCTTLISEQGSWEGLLQGLLVLGMLWWSWVGYAWLTSVVNPEEGLVRLVMFLAMGAFLIAALSVPGSFGHDALTFALAYAAVRIAHILLFMLASREDAELRHSVLGLAVSTAIGSGLLLAASLADGGLQLGLWGLALVLDAGGPLVIEPAGWRLVPGHFAERHGAIVIIALGESIVAIGVGAHEHVDAGIVAAAVLGLVVAASLWWAYFDVTAIVGRRVLERAQPGREQNRLARDGYSYLHFPMVAGIALLSGRGQADGRGRRRQPGDRAGPRARGRGRRVPARAGRLPAAHAAHAGHPQARDGRSGARRRAAARRDQRAGDAGDRERDAGGDDRLRGLALR